MERVEKYRELVKQVLEEYASYKFSSGEIEVMPIFDLERDHYQVVSAGWKDERRIYGCSVHIDIKDSKIWIQHDGTEIGFADEFVRLGVASYHIVLAYHSPFMRQFNRFAVS